MKLAGGPAHDGLQEHPGRAPKGQPSITLDTLLFHGGMNSVAAMHVVIFFF